MPDINFLLVTFENRGWGVKLFEGHTATERSAKVGRHAASVDEGNYLNTAVPFTRSGSD